jgi:two-component system cell cycle response regulator
MKVLVADDSATIRALLRSSLKRWGFDEVVEASNGDEAWAHLQAEKGPGLALIDWEMPGLEGVELCRRVRQREEQGASAYTYMILFTARGGRRNVVSGMEAGADDYVVKPFDEHELRVRVRAGRRIVDLQSELYSLQEQFKTQSRTDPLTGCLNRRGMVERLMAELSLAGRDRRPVGVALLDLDHFKSVNDTYGHAAGDEVLKELVRRVNGTTRASDSIGRIGGEEFLVLWPGLTPEVSKVAAERVRTVVEEKPFEVGGSRIHMTASVGLTTTWGSEGQDTVVARADQALYAAKEAGRNRVAVA